MTGSRSGNTSDETVDPSLDLDAESVLGPYVSNAARAKTYLALLALVRTRGEFGSALSVLSEAFKKRDALVGAAGLSQPSRDASSFFVEKLGEWWAAGSSEDLNLSSNPLENALISSISRSGEAKDTIALLAAAADVLMADTFFSKGSPEIIRLSSSSLTANTLPWAGNSD